MFHVFLSSGDSISHFTDNKATDFTVQLPETLHFHSGVWSCGLVDLECSKMKGSKETFYVCADFVETSIANDRKMPVLRRVSTRDMVGRSIWTTFGDVIYVPVNVTSLSKMRLYIISEQNRSLPFAEDTDLRCTLRFVASR